MGNFLERLDPWAKDVDKLHSFLHIQRYEYASKNVKGVVLDVGCGLGYGSKMLYKVRNSVVGFDISSSALSYAKRIYPGPEYIKADAQMLPFADKSFDSVVALEIIEHVENGAHALEEINRVLKERGILILSTPNVDHLKDRLRRVLSKKQWAASIPENPYHRHEYTLDDLTKLLEGNGFVIRERRGQVLTLPLVHKLPPRLGSGIGRCLPQLSLHVIYEAQKTLNRKFNYPRKRPTEMHKK